MKFTLFGVAGRIFKDCSCEFGLLMKDRQTEVFLMENTDVLILK
jgi:hypothetical protein